MSCVSVTPGAMLPSSRGSSAAGPHSTMVGPEFRQQVNVRSRHAAVCDVADDRHARALRWSAFWSRIVQRIEQRLRGMLVRAVARVDDRNGQMARQKMRSAGCRVAHDNGVRPHRRQRVQRVHQGLALGDAGPGSGNRYGIGAQTLRRDLEAGARARGGFKEQVHHHAPAQNVRSLERLLRTRLKMLRPLQDRFDFCALQFFDSEQAGGLH